MSPARAAIAGLLACALAATAALVGTWSDSPEVPFEESDRPVTQDDLERLFGAEDSVPAPPEPYAVKDVARAIDIESGPSAEDPLIAILTGPFIEQEVIVEVLEDGEAAAARMADEATFPANAPGAAPTVAAPGTMCTVDSIESGHAKRGRRADCYLTLENAMVWAWVRGSEDAAPGRLVNGAAILVTWASQELKAIAVARASE